MISWCEGMVESFGELVNKNVGFGCIIMDQTGIRCTKCGVEDVLLVSTLISFQKVFESEV